MRILVVNNLYPPAARGGYEVECAGVVDHLRELHDVEVLSSRAGRGADTSPHVHRVLPLARQDRVSSFTAPIDAVAAAVAADELFERFRPDAIFVFNGAAIPHAALRKLALREVPMLVRVCEHWFGALYSGDRFMRHLVPGERGARAAWAVGMRAVNRLHPRLRLELGRRTPWAVSWNSDFMRENTPIPPGVEVVYEQTYLPVNPRVPRFAEIERLPAAANEPPVVFFAGRLDDRKGADVAVRALADLERRHGIAARLVVAGAASRQERGWLEGIAAGAGVADRVELTGPLDFDAMAERLATAAVWVVPSLWDEPAPTVALEAGLARVPAVLSRVGGTPEVLREEAEALFFAREDHGDCADALARALTDPDATAQRRDRAYERAKALSWDAYLESTDRFVEGALDALPSAPAAV